MRKSSPITPVDKKTPFKLFLLFLLGLALGLAAAEGVVRVAFPSYANGVRLFGLMESERGKFCRYDESLGWDGIPDVQGEFEWIDCRFRVRQNRYGYRGPAYDLTRSPKKRIVALGDSYTWGFGVDNEDMFTRVLEKESPAPVEVVNMGVSGYGTDQELLLWRRKARGWKPDTVWLVLNFLTDPMDNAGTARYGYEKPAFRMDPRGRLSLVNVPVPARKLPWSDPAQVITPKEKTLGGELVRVSALACLVASRLSQSPSWRRALEAKKIIVPMTTGYNWEAPMYQLPYAENFERHWALLDEILRVFGQEVAREGGRLKIVLIPSTVQVYPELWDTFVKRSPLPEGKRWEMEAPLRRIQEIARKHQIEVVDLLPDLREAGEKDAHLYFPYNMHWTRTGHRVAASTLLKHLE